jgi:hypothetical protein
MDSTKLFTLQELAPVIKFSYATLRNSVVVDSRDPSRGAVRLRYVDLPIFRWSGKNWLVRAADVAALINPPAADPADPAEAPTPPAARRPGRPRKGAPLAGPAGGVQ